MVELKSRNAAAETSPPPMEGQLPCEGAKLMAPDPGPRAGKHHFLLQHLAAAPRGRLHLGSRPSLPHAGLANPQACM